MQKFKYTALLGACLLVAAGAVQASATASSTMTNITFQLIDLNPNDGITPALTFTNGAGMSWTVYSYASNTQTFDVAKEQKEGYFVGPMNGTAGAVRDVAWLQTSVSGNPFAGTGALTAQGSAERTGYGLGYAIFHGDFTMTPLTQLVISAQVQLSGQTTGDGTEEAGSQYYLNLGGTVGGSSLFDTQQRFMNAVPQAGEMPGISHNYFLDQPISVSLRNATATNVTGYFDVGSTVSVNSNPLIVPEPQSAALMLAGLAGLLAYARRARGRKV